MACEESKKGLTVDNDIKAKLLTENSQLVETLAKNAENKKVYIDVLVERAEAVTNAAAAVFPTPPYDIHFSFQLYPEYPGDFRLEVKGVSSWKELEPLFERLDGIYPLDGWSTIDIAETYTRIYTHGSTRDQVLVVAATLVGDTKDCKRVLKGWSEPVVCKSSPIYGFDCVGEGVVTGIPTPDKLEDDIPF
jgi:hypothetical protein